MEIDALIGSLGFPIAMAVWLLWERATTMKQLTCAFDRLTDAIEGKKIKIVVNKDNPV